MESTINLSPEEMLAIQLLQSRPDVFQRIVENGTININAVLEWYQRLVMKLELSKAIRKQTYIDIEPIVEVVEATEKISEPEENINGTVEH